ncbi:MAG: preprotein translocase subunit SecE [Jaaginema sp. PMC 1079.18]|nr:preprotein translocase subunit SecE [Jaaginema sp. PMC 1080.18]MEC4852770.1 preprotein translocase subunit SecE [Jaaginema sp. PMC 1079.18]MEC4866136.1 preprotein translocase subunit SecE [Jaaginema sp. PMC 1078.18]
MAKKNAQKTEVTQKNNITISKSSEAKGDREGFQPTQFLAETKEELAKVVWPSRQQLLSESAAVLLMVILVSTTIYFVDNLFRWLSGMVF